MSDVSLLHNPKSLNSALHLPNGTTTSISHVGDIVLTSSVVLSEVLCVPSIQCNLISISKLTADSFASITFSKHNCLLQDHSQRPMVEIGKVDAGLYTFSSTSSTMHSHQCTRLHTEPSLEAQLWHARLASCNSYS